MELSNVIGEKTNSNNSITEITDQNFIELAHTLGKEFAIKTDEYDQSDKFVTESYATLKKHKIFSALIPKELGGYGISHQTMCDFLRIIAGYCSSTGLALSMHQHLISAAVYNYKNGKGESPILRKVVENQTVLVSTGARDWLESNGEMEKVEGGYLLTAQKVFASQSIVGDILITSAPFKNDKGDWDVLHFPIPIKTEGVSIKDNWYTMGMRSTGSNTVELNKVFIPEESIVLTRPRGDYHQVWSVVLSVAMPLIMSVYVGIAEAAAKKAISIAKSGRTYKTYLPAAIGELNNELATAQIVLKDMISIANNFDFSPEVHLGNDILTRKTIVGNACLNTASLSMKLVGGQSFFRKLGIEKMFRDMQAAAYHPLPEKDQHVFSGQFILNNPDY